jgi:hypothetical protein
LVVETVANLIQQAGQLVRDLGNSNPGRESSVALGYAAATHFARCDFARMVPSLCDVLYGDGYEGEWKDTQDECCRLDEFLAAYYPEEVERARDRAHELDSD